ncbi:MAG TPA: glucose-6-phosphate isomerase, partial [Alphaproteobacteria bacterium]|nr:glucose-6-phosphate isomerase [Alphaproteobacteria bacterium]
QQDMESNGKTVNSDGEFISDYQTGPVIFGEAGTNGQHSFYQFLHQGSDIVACDFIGIIQPDHTEQEHHNILLSNMLAQGQALMEGRQDKEDTNKYFSGSKPCSTLLLEKLDAFHLGMLIALYEHRVFVQGVIWNINSFDQFGVELGKELSGKIENNDLQSADSSTKGLFSLIHKVKK